MTSPRQDRIMRLIQELEYEITRGVMEHEIEPNFSFSKIIPRGPRETSTFRVLLYPSQEGDWSDPSRKPLHLRSIK